MSDDVKQVKVDYPLPWETQNVTIAGDPYDLMRIYSADGDYFNIETEDYGLVCLIVNSVNGAAWYADRVDDAEALLTEAAGVMGALAVGDLFPTENMQRRADNWLERYNAYWKGHHVKT